MLYLLHSGLNTLIHTMNKALHSLVAVVLFVMYSGLFLFSKRNFYYSSRLIVFIMIYIVVAYIKLYHDNTKIGMMFLVVGFSGFAFELNEFPLFVRGERITYWSNIQNPFLILAILGIIVLLSKSVFSNKAVNYFSGLSLIVYLVHEDASFRAIVRPQIWNNISINLSNHSLLIRFMIFASIIVLYGVGVSMIIQETIMPLIDKMCDRFSMRIHNLWIHYSNWCNRGGAS